MQSKTVVTNDHVSIHKQRMLQPSHDIDFDHFANREREIFCTDLLVGKCYQVATYWSQKYFPATIRSRGKVWLGMRRRLVFLRRNLILCRDLHISEMGHGFDGVALCSNGPHVVVADCSI